MEQPPSERLWIGWNDASLWWTEGLEDLQGVSTIKGQELCPTTPVALCLLG